MKDIKLYHGSKKGINGIITPVSRTETDFGCGFYMGTRPEQVKSLVSSKPEPKFYELNFKLSQIPKNRILTLQGMDWTYFVMYNRGEFNDFEDTLLYDRISHIADNKDVIVGLIADDSMHGALSDFHRNILTDEGLRACLEHVNYGMQYVAKTPFACSQIEILSEQSIADNEKSEYQKYRIERNQSANSIIDIYRDQYYGIGTRYKELLARAVEETENSRFTLTDEDLKGLDDTNNPTL